MKRLLIALLLVTTACANQPGAGNTAASDSKIADGVTVEYMTEGIFRVGKRIEDTKYGIVCYTNGSDTSDLECFEVGK